MKKLNIILPILAICTTAVSYVNAATSEITVRFMDNKNQPVITQSGMDAMGNSLLFEEIKINKGATVSIPETAPTMQGFDFTGWYTDRNCLEEFDFSTPLNRSITLYAGYSKKQEEEEEFNFTEVELAFEETIDNSIQNPIEITGVLNMPVTNSKCDISASGLAKLSKASSDCKKYLNYKRKSDVTNLSVTYSNKTINISYDYNQQSYNQQITLTLKDYTVDNSTYESKAKKYDAYEIEDYSLVLAGSSSMEFWTTSSEDLAMFTTTNIGIGGTTVSHWYNNLNKRLVYPANPRGIVYYLGINNIINSKDSGTSTGNQLVEMFNDIHSHLPDTTIYFVLINYVPDYMSYKNEIATANNIIKEYAQGKDYMVLLNPGELLMKSNNLPNRAYFRTDGLHMSLAGYVVWGGEVRRVLMEHEEELYGTKQY